MTWNKQAGASRGATRRDFLKKASLGGAAALAGLSIARGAHAAGNEVVKIGMIGCGGRCAGAAAESLKAGPFVKLAAMYDVFPERLEAKRKFFKESSPEQMLVDDAHCFTDFKGYQKVIESVDVVLIACASKFHPMYSLAAIQAGKHVFVEKPHAVDPVGCRQMQAACDLAKEKKLSLVSGLQSRFHVGYQECVKRIHDGQIGNVVAMQSMFLRGPYQLVSRNKKYSETQYQFSNWYHFCWLSGDDVPQSLVHNMDRMEWILKEETPKWCFGLGGRSSSFGEVYGDMFDHHTAVYEFKSGVRLYGLCQTRAGCYGNWDDILLGTKGVCHWTACKIEGETRWHYEGPKNDPHLAEQERLIGSIRAGKPINDGGTMIDSTYMAIMGQIACYTGKPVTWERMMAAEFEFEPKIADVRLDMEAPVKPDASGNYPLPKPGITDYF